MMISTIFLMASPEFQMSVSFPSMVDLIPICDLGQEGSRMFGKWMECEAIDNQERELRHRQYGFMIDSGILHMREMKLSQTGTLWPEDQAIPLSITL
jgi:hypothetical protein